MSSSNAVVTPEKGSTTPPALDAANAKVQLEEWAKKIASLSVGDVATEEDFKDAEASVVALFDHWKLKCTSDLRVFESKDLTQALKQLPNSIFSKELAHCKRLQFIMFYLHHQYPFDTDTTMREIINAKSAQKTQPARFFDDPSSKDDSKITIPDLEPITGSPQTYFSSREALVNTLGQAKLGHYLDKDSISDLNGTVKSAVFYAMRKAMAGGFVSHLADKMYSDNHICPATLFERFNKYFDTPEYRSNVAIHEFQHLFEIRLDVEHDADEFIKEFQRCIIRLRECKAKIVDDNIAMRAILVRSLQDTDYDTVRAEIMKMTDASIDVFLDKIRQRKTELQLLDGVPMHGEKYDETTSSKARRGRSEKGRTNRFARQGDDTRSKWCVPFFPSGWQAVLGKKVFDVLLQWRADANKGKPVSFLNHNHNLRRTERVVPVRNRRNKRKNTDREDDGEDQNTTSSTTDSSHDQPLEKRIRIERDVNYKGRRLITEFNQK